MHSKNFKKELYSYALFSVFSVLALAIVSISAVDLERSFNNPVKAETVTKLWIGDALGYIKSCSANASCTSHGQIGSQILGMGYFNNRVWISELTGIVLVCDYAGSCASLGDQGTFAYNMAEFNNRIWIGENDGTLIACDTNSCTSYGDKGAGINGIAVFDNKLWIGQNDGKLQSCDSSGECIDYGTKSSAASYANRLTGIISIETFADKLWLCAETGELKACDATGECTNHGDRGYQWSRMSVFNEKLWFITQDGYLQSCDSEGSCTNYGQKATSTTNFAIATYENKLWLGLSSHLYSCDSSGNCTDHGDQGGIAIEDMVSASLDSSASQSSEGSVPNSCTDSDNGKNYEVKGYILRGFKYSEDTCSDAYYLLEYHCYLDGLNGKHYSYYRCPNGCKNGTCIPDSNSTSNNTASSTSSSNNVSSTTSNISTSTSSSDLSSSTDQSNISTSTEKKVMICHIPPGNEDNKKTIEVGESAVRALLDQGSYLGKCIEEQEDTATSTVDNSDDRKNKIKNKDQEIVQIEEKARNLLANKIDDLLFAIKESRDRMAEQQIEKKYLARLKVGVGNLSENLETAINSFITYGIDENTKKLGAGERAAVMYSYKEAYGKLPETEVEMSDAIKIANGRWPILANEEAEKRAKEEFRKVYKHVADMNDPKDNAAVTIMAYGLRQRAENRNLVSEQQGISIYESIYNKVPSSTGEWNVMQAITYSGAMRGIDSDNDLLTDEQEEKLGTDPKKADSDGDGYNDGIEFEDGYNPKGVGKIKW